MTEEAYAAVAELSFQFAVYLAFGFVWWHAAFGPIDRK